MIGCESRQLASSLTKKWSSRSELTIMRIVVTGASGRLSAYLIDRLVADGRHEVDGWSGSAQGVRGAITLRTVELTAEEELAAALGDTDPQIVIHAAAISSADAMYLDLERARAVNIAATRRLAAWAARHDRRLLFTSTDLVFDGSRSWNREEDPADPILEYGRTKRAAEPFVLAVPGGLVCRLSLLYGSSRWGKPSIFDRAVGALRNGLPQTFFEDEFRTPLDYQTAALMLVRLAESETTGLIHLGGPERLSRFEMMRRVAVIGGIDPGLVRANRRADSPLPEPRPADVSLDSTRFAFLFPGLDRPVIETALLSVLR
jgi:dTDP-4-dehydrorhamnose reductase